MAERPNFTSLSSLAPFAAAARSLRNWPFALGTFFRHSALAVFAAVRGSLCAKLLFRSGLFISSFVARHSFLLLYSGGY